MCPNLNSTTEKSHRADFGENVLKTSAMRDKRIKAINKRPLGQEGNLTEGHPVGLAASGSFLGAPVEPMILAGHMPGSWTEPSTRYWQHMTSDN